MVPHYFQLQHNSQQKQTTNMQHPPQNNMPVPGAPGGPPQQANGTGGPAGHDDSYFTEVSVHFLNISYVIFLFGAAFSVIGL